MTTELVSFNERKAKKAPKCEFCGEPEHAATLACPRVAAVTYDGDAITIELYPIEPVAGDGGI
jgi:hypothetical protein